MSKFNYKQFPRDKINIETVKSKNKLTIFESKIGGIPYWPEDKVYPKINGNMAKLFAQINFTDLSIMGIELPNYPNKGLLQFFIEDGDDMWGINFDDILKSNICIVYHKNINENSYIDEDILSISNDYSFTPFDGELAMKFEKEIDYLSPSDDYWVKILYKDTLDNLDDDTMDLFYDEVDNGGSKIGGYAYFTQSDPRYNMSENDKWLTLLQIDSDENLMFGDSGVANWFIKEEDLIKLDFSKAFFNWDCC